jgi:ribosomal protein S18 acetylase RimI-like enzyme
VPITYRQAREGDARAILQVWLDSGLTESVTDDAANVECAIREATSFAVAEAEGRLIGTLIAGFDGWRGNFYRLAVIPEFRRRGVARALVASAEHVFRERGVRRVSALVEREREHSIRFWTAIGYTDDVRLARFVRTL